MQLPCWHRVGLQQVVASCAAFPVSGLIQASRRRFGAAVSPLSVAIGFQSFPPIYALHWCIHPCQETPCTYLHTQNNGVSHLVLVTSCSGSVRSLASSDLIWHLHTILLVLLHGAAAEGRAVLHATLAADWPLLLGCLLYTARSLCCYQVSQRWEPALKHLHSLSQA